MRIRPRSLRFRVFVILLFVAAAPVVFVWLTNLWDTNTGVRMRDTVERAAVAAAQSARDPEWVEREARRHGVWMRVVEGENVVASFDRETPDTVVHRLGDMFFGPDGAPSLTEFDTQREPVDERHVVRQARAEGRAVTCLHSPLRRLHVCEAAVHVGGVTVVATESTRRAVRALYDVRYQLLKLSFFVAVSALLLGAWLAWRIVAPIDALKRQLVDRTEGRRPSTAPIELDRDDEFGDVAGSVNQLLAALEARERANEGLVADLVHELKNPVAAIRSAAESLGQADQVSPERAARVSRILLRSSARLDAVVSDLLELARAEAGLHRAERAALDVAPLVGDIVDRLRADERFASLDFSIAGDSASITAAEADLSAALGNLLENAATHAQSAVKVQIESRSTTLAIRIRDDGAGIAADDLPRVFDRFFTTRAGGTGLGLALARAIIEAHGGSVSAASPGGAEFTVCLPRA